ncbi:MAG TPA: hypothetical protein VHE58_09260 [Burkholderiales bacterium]|nr:hypothetical protein [Burkholderiales bacterium]
MRKLAEVIICGLTLVFLSTGLAYAKLPPPSEEAKAKAAEAKAKADHGDKVGAYKLCLTQNRVAEHYLKAKGVKPELSACQDPGPFGAAPAPDAKSAQAAPQQKK